MPFSLCVQVWRRMADIIKLKTALSKVPMADGERGKATASHPAPFN